MILDLSLFRNLNFSFHLTSKVSKSIFLNHQDGKSGFIVQFKSYKITNSSSSRYRAWLSSKQSQTSLKFSLWKSISKYDRLNILFLHCSTVSLMKINRRMLSYMMWLKLDDIFHLLLPWGRCLITTTTTTFFRINIVVFISGSITI